MNTLQLNAKSDLTGTLASALCLIHCIATPFIFVANAGVSEHIESHPQWWGILDIFFLAISFIAVWWSGKTTSKKTIGLGLWFSWLVLASIVINEKLSLFPLEEGAIYLPSISLIVLHLYNRKYCRCEDEKCCAA